MVLLLTISFTTVALASPGKYVQLEKGQTIPWAGWCFDGQAMAELVAEKELQEQKLRPVTSVGYVIKEDNDSVILVSSFDEESQCGGGGVVIRTNCITKKTILKGQINVE